MKVYVVRNARNFNKIEAVTISLSLALNYVYNHIEYKETIVKVDKYISHTPAWFVAYDKTKLYDIYEFILITE